MPWQAFKILVCSVLVLTALFSSSLKAREISSYALINDDGSLRIQGKTIHLYGIHIPKTGKYCQTNISPVVCGSRAALALEFIIKGFVRCEIIEKNSDGSLVGLCWVKATNFNEVEDLSAYLLEHGWAVALPDAPIEYQTLEKISRLRGSGIWGFQIDNRTLRTN
ncbi:MAG: thermonuclease family protein [Gammaproteobacteria bacterium]|jgi:endonuclease YncB( thermonuclease family)